MLLGESVFDVEFLELILILDEFDSLRICFGFLIFVEGELYLSLLIFFVELPLEGETRALLGEFIVHLVVPTIVVLTRFDLSHFESSELALLLFELFLECVVIGRFVEKLFLLCEGYDFWLGDFNLSFGFFLSYVGVDLRFATQACTLCLDVECIAVSFIVVVLIAFFRGTPSVLSTNIHRTQLEE